MAASIDTLRVGKKYYLKNFGEVSEFQILESTGENDFKVKDLTTLEVYYLSDLIKYGRSDDFELDEIR